MTFKSVGALLLLSWAVSSCEGEPSAPGPLPARAPVRTARQEVRSGNKVLILGSSVADGLNSPEAQAVYAWGGLTPEVVTPAQWHDMTADQFMSYQALIIGDAACEAGPAAYQVAIDTRATWGAIVDGDVAIVAAAPSSNGQVDLVNSAVTFALNTVQYRTGMYIALGCAYDSAPPNTAVDLLEPFGTFKVQGLSTCADNGHIFQMSNDVISRNMWDGLLVGNDGCSTRTVFTSYPDRTFSYVALAQYYDPSVPIPGQKIYSDFTCDYGNETPFVGTPYVLVRGAMPYGGGCGAPDWIPSGEECDLGDGINGAPATNGGPADGTCSWSCRQHWCGDGHVDTEFGEECDNGSNNGRSIDTSGNLGACSSFCKIPHIPSTNHPPVAVCANRTVSATNQCGMTADINNGSSDPDNDLVGCVQSPAGPYNIGNTTVTLTCTDQKGNSNACSATVTVLDKVAPVVTLTAPVNQSLECTKGGTYTDPGYSANDMCSGPLPQSSVTKTGTVNVAVPSAYTLSYSATDPAGNRSPTVTRNVTVADTLAPVITAPVAGPVECGVMGYTDTGVTANDQCEGDITAKIVKSGSVNTAVVGNYPLQYTVSDTSGHAAQATRTVPVRDTIKPTVTLNSPVSQTVECGGTYTDPGATASDLCAGTLVASINSSTINMAVPGSYVINYKATDPSGNAGVSPGRSVTVQDSLAPKLTLVGSANVPLECAATFTDPGATANDQCYGNLTSSIVRTGTLDNKLLNTPQTLTYNVKDAKNNAATPVTRTVTVSDTQAPSVTISGALSQMVECGSSYTDQGATANDACAGVLPAVATSTPNANAPGNYAVSYTATDPSGNVGTSSGSRTVTVEDSLPPTITLNGLATLPLECGSTFNDPGATATDQCVGNLNVTVAGGVNNKAPADYTLTYSANDGSGHIASTARTVKVRDTQVPTITVLGATDQTFECGSTYTDPGATANDACAGNLTSAIQTTQSGDTSSTGQFTIQYSVTDPSGNKTVSPTVRTVHVNDDEAPMLALLGPSTQSLECGSPYTDPGATASDACFGNISSRITKTGLVNNMAPAQYQVTYNVTDPAGNAAPAVHRTVNVSDTRAPSITVLGPLTQSVQCGSGAYADPGATASDACAGDLTAAIVKTGSVNSGAAGSYTIKYSVADPSGNSVTSSDVRSVTVVDELPPSIALNGSPSPALECGTPFSDPGATANDACAGDLTAQILKTGTVNEKVLAVYPLRYSVTDPSNHTATVDRTVTVSDTLPPTLALNGSATQVVECGSSYLDPGATATDVCAGNLDAAVTVSGSVNAAAVGSYNLTYNVSDTAGHAAAAVTRAVQVKDTQKPTISVTGPLDQTFECGSTYTDPGATASDACAGNLTAAIVAQRSGNTNQQGQFTITYSVTDPSGNKTVSPTVRTVHVNDNVAPTLALKGAALVNLECGSAYADPGAMAQDVCEGNLTASITTSGTVNSGTPNDYTLIYNVADTAGNSAPSVSRKVHVQDTQKPTLTVLGPASTTYECGTTYTDSGATATDSCAGNLTSRIVATQTPNPNQPSNFTITYSVSDPSGNTTVSPVTRTVTMNDNQPPTISLNGPASQVFECSSNPYADPGATANDSCVGSVPVSVSGSVNTRVAGHYVLSYSAQDTAGNTSPMVTRDVQITDTVGPAITVNGGIAVTVECKGTYTDLGATAEDVCSGPAPVTTDNSVTTDATGFYLVRYSATDASGNTNMAVRNVNVTDTQAPVISLNQPIPMQLECGSPYVDPGATASDACQGDVTSSVFVEFNGVDNKTEGSYIVKYRSRDNFGNTAHASRDVRVRDTTAPVLTVVGPATEEIECGVQPALGVTATDACYGDLTANIVATPATLPKVPGDYTVFYSVTDPAGNRALNGASRHFTVVDPAPELQLNGADTESLECGSFYADPGATAYDVCFGDVTDRITQTGSVNTKVPVSYSLAYNVTGPTGESAPPVYRTVNVYDTQAPSITILGPLDQQFQCGSGPYVDPGALATDTCAGDLSAAIVTTDTVNPRVPGHYTVVYNVADPSGNTAPAASRTVEVVDDQPPEIACPGPTVVELFEGEEATVTLEAARATDACDPEVRISGPTQTRFPLGTTTVTYTATDASGNTATCSSTITVLTTAPPDTFIVSSPPDQTEDAGATFVFDATKSNVTYECSLDGADFTPCPASTQFTELAEGKHTLQVRARDSAGQVDPTPAAASWTVLPPAPIGSPDRDFLGGGRGCSSTEGGPSWLAMLGLGLFVALRARKRTGTRVLALATLLLEAKAFAQPQPVPSFELELLKLNPSGTGSLVLGTGELLPAGAYRLSLTTYYEKDPLVLFQDGARLGAVVRHRATAQLAAAYGLWGRVELGVQLPVLLLQRGDDLTAQGVAPPAGGPALGTPLLTLRAKLLAEREQDPVDLSLGVQAGPPLGRGTALARELRATPSLMVGRRFGFLRAGVDAGVLLRSHTILSPDTSIHDEIGHALRLGAALATVGEGMRGELAVIASVPLSREGSSVETLVGARLPWGDSLEAYGLAGLGYGNAPGTPDFRLLLGVAYGRTHPACVTGGRHQPQSCPDLDDDGDGVKNRDDLCPLEPGSMDNQGCPLKDTDSDGIADGVDRSPAKDSDADGVLDAEDACPAEAGIPEMHGCPAKDTDTDSVLDHLDNCPEVAGPVENHGCPAKEKQLVAIQKGRIDIQDTVHFEFDQATIQPRSFPLLDQVAQVLVEHPEILSVTIEGHTDDRGSAEYNRDLSQRRAESVRDYFAQKGVARERMEPKGFGKERPVQPNTTEEGRAANRRVEFITRYVQAVP